MEKYQQNDILDDEKLRIDLCEVESVVTGTSYDTIQYIKRKYETEYVFFGIDSDKISEIPRWQYFEDIISSEKFLILPRADVIHF